MRQMNLHRVRTLREGMESHGPVVYWMSRDQRVSDNWALLYAQSLSRKKKVPMAVIFTLSPKFLGATYRQYEFMLQGLEQVERTFARLQIPFVVLFGSPAEDVSGFVSRHKVSALVTDFSPLRIHREWKEDVMKRIRVPFYEVDAHNIVPCWLASQKLEYAASTFRPRIHRLLPAFLDEFPSVGKNIVPWIGRIVPTNWKLLRKKVDVERRVMPVEWVKPGEQAANEMLGLFIERKLSAYGAGRNDPTRGKQSNLSPYLHFGQIAPQRVVLEVMRVPAHPASRETLLEEIIVRRELSDNFCFYNPLYDSFDGFPGWAKATLNAHRSDFRTYRYTRSKFENALTHDELWNAAQMEMVTLGKMHGYMRMYWAKKILEWSSTPEEALNTAIYLNDKYELDGRDPNGYAGIAWSIGGVHDRAWGDRPVFGKVRYMSFEGCKRKFDVNKYITRAMKPELFE